MNDTTLPVWERARARKAAHAAENRARLDALKIAAGCMDCGYRAHPAALHLDHRPGTVKDMSARGRAVNIGWSWRRILAVVALCDVVCANCHAVRTASRGYVGTGRPRQS